MGSPAFSMVLSAARIPAQRLGIFGSATPKPKSPLNLGLHGILPMKQQALQLQISLLTDSAQYKPGY